MIKILVFILSALIVSGCEKEKRDYDWYMLHPLELRQDIGVCMSHAGREKNATECGTVMRAGANMTVLVNQQQENPEKFGEKVLDAQERLVILHEDVIKARAALTNKNSTQAELKSAQDNLEKTIKAYENQQKQINVYLAVIGLSSPD